MGYVLCSRALLPGFQSDGPQPCVNQPAVTERGLVRGEQCYGIRMSRFERRALKTLRKYPFRSTISSVLLFQSWLVRVRWWNLFTNQLRCSKTVKKSTVLAQPTFNYAYIACFLLEWFSTITSTSRFTVLFRNHELSVWLFFLHDIFCVCVCIKKFTMDWKRRLSCPAKLTLTHRRKDWAMVTHKASQVKAVPCKFAIIDCVSEPWKST